MSSSTTTIGEAPMEIPLTIPSAIRPIPIHTIVAHKGAHLDELIAVVLLVTFGEEFFPGVSAAEFEFWDRLPEEKIASNLEKRGYLAVGFAGSRFDEHPDLSTGKMREAKQSAVSLVARYLGVTRDSTLRKFIRFTTSRDLGMAGHFEFSRIVKDMNYLGRPPLEVFQWVCRAFKAVYTKGPEYFEGGVKANAGPEWAAIVKEWVAERFDVYPKGELAMQKIVEFTGKRLKQPFGTTFELHSLFAAVREVASNEDDARDWAFEALDVVYDREIETSKALREVEKAQVRCLNLKGKDVTVIAGLSNSPYFTSAARRNRNAGLIVQRNRDSGNINIQTDKALDLDLTGVVRMLRTKELKALGEALPRDRGLLSAEGTFAGWHFFPEGKMILRGSLSHHAPPTRLSFGTVVQAVCSELR